MMTWRNVYAHYGIYRGWPVTEELAKECYKITRIYPADLKELKKAMMGHDLSLLLTQTN